MSKTRFDSKLSDVLLQCERFLPAGVTYVPADKRSAVRCSTTLSPFCRECLLSSCPSQCRSAILSGARQGYLTGEPYYTPCWAGLNTAVFPIAPDGRFKGALEMGGFCYPEIREDTLAFVQDSVAALSATLRGRLTPHARNFVEIPTMEVRGYSEFLYNALFAAGLNSVDDFRQRREKYLQQRRIADLMQRQGTAPPRGDNALEGLSAFAFALRQGDRHRAMMLLDNLLSRILMVAADSPGKVRAHVLPMLSLLESARLLAAEKTQAITTADQVAALRALDALDSTEDICYWIFQRVREFLDGSAAPTTPRRELGGRAADYLAKHYARPLTLVAAARATQASVSALRRAILEETGRTFHRQLLHIRVQEARELLLTSDRPVQEIGADCGFYDAPHFSRLFKRETGYSPSAYRRSKRKLEPVQKGGSCPRRPCLPVRRTQTGVGGARD